MQSEPTHNAAVTAATITTGSVSALWASGAWHVALAAAFLAALLSRLWSNGPPPDGLRGWLRALAEFTALVLISALAGVGLGDSLAAWLTGQGIVISHIVGAGIIGGAGGFFLQNVVEFVRARGASLSGGSARPSNQEGQP